MRTKVETGQSFTNDLEGKVSLRNAMRGRRVFIDDYPYSQRGALEVLQEDRTLTVEYADDYTLKLDIVWGEWEVSA